MLAVFAGYVTFPEPSLPFDQHYTDL